MATTLTREQMFAEIIAQDESKLDVVADTRRMSAIVGPEIDSGPNVLALDVDTVEDVKTFVLNDHARSQVATDLGIPKRYFDRMLVDAPGLLGSNVNHWLANQPNRRLVRGFTNGNGRAWLSDRYRRLDNVEIARNIFPVFDEIDGLTFHQAQLTDTRFYLRATLPSLQAEVGVGDVVQAGIEIRNSEVGAGALVIQPFILRLVCTNGMTVADSGVRRNHVGRRIEDDVFYSDEALEADDKALWLVARDTVKTVLQEVRFNEIVEQLRETLGGDRIQAPAAATEVLATRFSLTEVERENVLRNLVNGGDTSQWGLLNAVTAAAKESPDFDRQAELEAAGWALATLPRKEWASIATV